MLPSLSDLGVGGRAGRCRTSATAPIARCASCSSGSRSRRPLVLVLDDVHWADAASVELLAALLRSPPDAAVLLVLAARPRQSPDRLAAALERADRQGASRASSSAASRARRPASCSATGVGRERADELYEEAGGNPFYLQQLARSHGAGGARASPLAGAALEAVGVPAAVIASLAEELGAAVRRHAPGAARRGRLRATRSSPISPPPRPASDDATAMEAFDELLDLGLVRSTDVPRRFRFRHPLVRRAVYESAPGGWLLGAHERCAQVLAERGAPAAARAHHVEFAARHGRPGGRGRAHGGRDGGDPPRPRQRRPLVQRRPAPDARSRARRAAGRAPAGPGPRARRAGPPRREPCRPAREHRARPGRSGGPARAADDDVRRRRAPARPPRGGARAPRRGPRPGSGPGGARRDRAHDRARDRRAVPRGPRVGLRLGQRARSQAARELGERPLVAAAAAILTLGHAVAGSIAEARSAYAEASALLAAMSDEELSARVDAAAYLASAATYLDRYDEAVAHAERALRLGRAAGHLHPTLLPALGAAHFMRGRLGEAAKVLDDGVEAARLVGITQSMAWMLRNRALLSVVAGDLPAALEMAEEALELTQRLDESVLSSWAAMAVARASVMAGRSQRAVDVLGGGRGGAAADPRRLAGDGPRGAGDGLRGPRPRRRGGASGGGRRSARGRPGAADGDRLGAARRRDGRPARRRARPRRPSGRWRPRPPRRRSAP